MHSKFTPERERERERVGTLNAAMLTLCYAGVLLCPDCYHKQEEKEVQQNILRKLNQIHSSEILMFFLK